VTDFVNANLKKDSLSEISFHDSTFITILSICGASLKANHIQIIIPDKSLISHRISLIRCSFQGLKIKNCSKIVISRKAPATIGKYWIKNRVNRVTA